MEAYQGIHLSLRLPESMSNPNTFSYITHTTKKIADQVDLQSEISLLLYSLYSNLSSSVQKLCLQSESKYSPSPSANTVVCRELTKTIHLAFHNLYQISFKHQIDLKTTVKRQREESWMSSIDEKLSRVKVKTETYAELYKEFEEKEKQYVQKTHKFLDVETNTVKYYSLHRLNSKISRIISMELDLQKILLKLQSQHSYIQLLYKETHKLLFELVSSKVKKIYDIISSLRETLTKLFSSQDMIVEQGSRDHLTSLTQQNADQHLNIKSPQQAIEAAKQVLTNQRQIRNIFQQFLINLISVIETHDKKSKDSHLKKLTLNLQRQKNIIEQNLGCGIYYQGADSSQLIKLFQDFIDQIVYKLKNHRNLSKYRVMEEELFNRLEKELKSFSNNLPNGDSIQDNQELYNYYVEMTVYLKKKYSRQAEDINNSFREEVHTIIKQFKDILHNCLVQLQSNGWHKPTSNRLQSLTKLILSSHQYSIFQNSFILNPPQYKFIRSPHINLLLKLKSEIQNPVDFSVNLSSDTKSSSSKGCIQKVGCCGIISQGSEMIDEFHCALVDSILLQGKLKLYRKQILFMSMFNKRTLLGKTEIRIPAREIINIQKDRKSINGIIIQTQHGTMIFTSFLNSPLPIMLSSYKLKSEHHKSQRGELEMDNILKKPSNIRKDQTLKSLVVNRFISIGFVFKSPSMLQKQFQGFTQTAIISQQGNNLSVEMEYIFDGNSPQIYRFSVVKNHSKLDLKYSLGVSSNREYKNMFLNFIRSFMGREEANIQNTRSEIFDISSIEHEEEREDQKPKMARMEMLITDKDMPVQFYNQNENIKKQTEKKEFVPLITQEALETTCKAFQSAEDIKQKSKIKLKQKHSSEMETSDNAKLIYLIIAVISIILLLL